MQAELSGELYLDLFHMDVMFLDGIQIILAYLTRLGHQCRKFDN